MIVTVSGLSGLLNAYVSVLSAEGSSEINGASRWLDAVAAVGPDPRAAKPATTATAAASAARMNAAFRILCSFRDGPIGGVAAVVSDVVRRDGEKRSVEPQTRAPQTIP